MCTNFRFVPVHVVSKIYLVHRVIPVTHLLRKRTRPLSSKMSSFDFQDTKLDNDKELQAALQQEQAKAHFQSQIHKLTDTCWDTCFDKPRDKMDSRTETCMSNCVDRFIDTSLLVASRFQQILQRAASQ